MKKQFLFALLVAFCTVMFVDCERSNGAPPGTQNTFIVQGYQTSNDAVASTISFNALEQEYMYLGSVNADLTVGYVISERDRWAATQCRSVIVPLCSISYIYNSRNNQLRDPSFYKANKFNRGIDINSINRKTIDKA